MITSSQQRVRHVPAEYDMAAADAQVAALQVQQQAAAEGSDEALAIAVALTACDNWRVLVAANIEAAGGVVPVYFFRSPGVFDIEEIRSRLAARGAIEMPNDHSILTAAREIVDQLADADYDRADEYRLLIDQAVGELADNGAIAATTVLRVEAMYRQLAVFEDFAALIAQRRRYMALLPLVVAQMCVVGWENVTDREDATRRLKFRRGGTGVPEDLLGRIRPSELRGVGIAAWTSGHITVADRKNSAPPSSSGSSPKPSTTAATAA